MVRDRKTKQPWDDIPRADCSVQKQKLKYKAAEQTTGKEIKDED